MTELPPDPTQASDAPWFRDAVVRIRAARQGGDVEEAARLRDYVRREGGEQLALLVDQTIDALDDLAAATAAGRPMKRRDIGLNPPGQRICDFCTAPAIAYYPFTEFVIAGARGDWASGDRWYVCVRCHYLVEAGDWRGLRDWVGPGAKQPAMRMVWNGFRMNRTGPAVFFEAGTDPEEGRT